MRFKDSLIVTRSWSLAMTVMGVSIGSALAWQDGPFSFWIYLICLFAALLFHAGANTLNDFFDLKNKVDSPIAPTALYRPHPVFTGLLTLKELLAFSLFLLGFSLVLGIILALIQSPRIFLLLFIGLLLAFFYTARPVSFKYFALGELVVFLAFGPLMIEGAYLVQRNAFSGKAFYVSVPYGLMVALVLLANNLRDMNFDNQSGIRTLATLLGRSKTLHLYAFISLTVFILMPIFILLGILHWSVLFVLFYLPISISLIKEFSQRIPINADAKTSRLTLSFGFFLILSLLIEKGVF